MGVDVARPIAGGARPVRSRSAACSATICSRLQNDGPEERLRETQFSQPAIFVTNLALYYAVGDAPQPVVSAGHSFGEFCSLMIAGSLSFEEALRIVDRTRPGDAGRCGTRSRRRCRRCSDSRRVPCARVADAFANDNRASRATGELQLADADRDQRRRRAVRAAGDAMLAAGAKRVVPLNVSGAWHSELMEPARRALRRAPSNARTFTMPHFDVISNVDAQPYRDVGRHSGRISCVRSPTKCAGTKPPNVCCRTISTSSSSSAQARVLAPLMKRMANAPKRCSSVSDVGVEKLRAKLARRRHEV